MASNAFYATKSIKLFKEFLDYEEKRGNTNFYYELEGGIGLVTYIMDKSKFNLIKVLVDRHPDIFKVKNSSTLRPNWTFTLYLGGLDTFNLLSKFITSDLINDTDVNDNTAISRMIEGHIMDSPQKDDMTVMIKAMIDKGADLTVDDGRDGYSPIVRLAAFGFLDALKYALKKHPELIKHKNKRYGSNLLMTSVDNMMVKKKERLETFKYLLNTYPELMEGVADDGTTFMGAVKNNTSATEVLMSIISSRKLGKFKDFLDL